MSKELSTLSTRTAKTVFLDYDGVLTSRQDGGFWSLDPDKYKMSERCFGILKAFLDKTGAKVVVSSNWRKFDDDGYWLHGSGKYFNPLPALRKRLGGYIIGSLSPKRHTSKLDALRLYIEEHEVENYVIFDDDIRENFQSSEFRDRFVMTDCETGITEEDCAKAEKILK